MANNLKQKNIWLVGAGAMAIEYAKVLNALNLSYEVIGRGNKNAQVFKEQTGKEVITGGIDKFLDKKPKIPKAVIVATNIQNQYHVLKSLLNSSIKTILVEKPGCLFVDEIKSIEKLAKQNRAKVLIAYNRRFYNSVNEALKIIRNDGGLTSFYFDFTEWSDQIIKLDKPLEVKRNWFYVNSTHVLDLAFFIGGYPKSIKTFTSGSLSWHKRGAIFNGSGVTLQNTPFSYKADWMSAGRWSIELFTKKHRLVLRPLENLLMQNKNSLEIKEVKLKNKKDIEFKPGLFLEVKSFLSGEYKNFPTIKDHLNSWENFYKKILEGNQ